MNPIDDDELGHFVYDDRVSWYTATVESPRGPVRLRIDAGPNDNLQAGFERAREVVRALRTYEELAKRYAAEELLQLKNDVWSDEDEEPLDEDAFVDRMVLTSVVVRGDGELSFYHDDGDMFWGHCIQVGVGAHREKLYAQIAG